MNFLKNKDTSVAIVKTDGNTLQIPYKKSESDYSRGYNTALRKCNARATKIINRMMEAYIKAIEEDDDF